MIEHITAWQCIGCGKLDAPRPCIGVCEDRKVELVPARDYDDAIERLRRADARIAVLQALTRLLATTTPSADQWQRTYLALQRRARKVLEGDR